MKARDKMAIKLKMKMKRKREESRGKLTLRQILVRNLNLVPSGLKLAC